ncbi:glycine zipper family protein [Sulfitobacter sp. LCG007]
MYRFVKLSAVPLLMLASACATTGANVQPVVDGPVSANYNYDLQQCQQLAASQGVVGGSTGRSAATGAVAGAGTAAIVKNKGNNVRDAALVGALVGVTADQINRNQSKEQIVRNCMRGRGYNVVG